MNFKTESLKLAAQGFRIFPVHGISSLNRCTCGNPKCGKNTGKHPRVAEWQNQATTSRSQIAEWHIELPGSNIGIATGAFRDGMSLLVIDIDDNTCPTALELLPLLPATLSARTGRESGMHRYYATVGETGLTANQLGGVDIRGRGGFVVAPPSKHKSGSVYEWVDETSIAFLPEEVIALLQARVKVKKASSPPKTVSGKVPDGERHDFLRREIARRVFSGRMSRGEVSAVVDKFLLEQVENGEDVPQQEIDSLIDSAFDKKSDYRLTDFSEMGSAEKFVEYYKDDLVRLTSGEWFHYTNGLWKPCTQPEILFKPVRRVIYDVNMDFLKANVEPGDTEANAIVATKVTKLGKFFHEAGRHRFCEAIVKFATPDMTTEVNDFTTPDDTLPFGNGLLDMVSGDFRPFRPEDHVVATLNCDFEPSATCAKWEETINFVTGGDPDIIRYHQQVFGYLLSTRTMRGVFFLVGAKSTGKTTLISALAEILGNRYAGTAQLGLIHTTKSFTDDEDMSRAAVALVGKRFVFMDETKKDAVIDPSKFKRIASRDAVLTARHLRHDAFSFTNQAKIVIMTNNQPNIDVHDSAAWDRVIYLPFLVSIPKEQRKEGFKNELIAEASGVINWCLKGFQDYLENGLVQPTRVQEKVLDWQLESSSVGQFIEDACVFEPGAKCTTVDLWEAFQRGDYETEHKSATSFGKELLRLVGDKVESKRTASKRFLTGIKLKGF